MTILAPISNQSKIVRLVNSSELRKNAFSGGVLAIGNLLLVLISYPIYLSNLGAELYGLWVVLSVIISLSQIGNLGIHHAVARHVAACYGREEFRDAYSFIGASLILIAPICLIVIGVSILFSSQISESLGLSKQYTSVSIEILPFIGLISSIVLVVDVLRGVLVGIGRMSMANYYFLFIRIIQFMTSVLLLMLGYGLKSLVVGTGVGYLLVAIIYIAAITSILNIPMREFFLFTLRHFKTLIGFGFNMFSSNLISVLMDPFNKILLSRYVGLESVTFYEIGIKGAQAIRGIYEGMIKALLPTVSQLSTFDLENLNKIRQVHKKVIFVVILTAAPIFLGLFYFAEEALGLWLKSRYEEDMVLVLRWFLVGYILNLISVPAYYVLLGLNKSKYCLYAASLRSILHFTVLIALVLVGLIIDLEIVVVVHVMAMIVAAIYVLTIYNRTMDVNMTRAGASY